MVSRKLLDDFERAVAALAAAGHAVAAVVADYRGGADFHTYLELPGHPAEQDHALLDAVRELAVRWSNARHAGQLVWRAGA